MINEENYKPKEKKDFKKLEASLDEDFENNDFLNDDDLEEELSDEQDFLEEDKSMFDDDPLFDLDDEEDEYSATDLKYK